MIKRILTKKIGNKRKQFQGYRCKSGSVIFAFRFTLNFAYSPFLPLALQVDQLKMGSVDLKTLANAYPDLTDDERQLLADIRRFDRIQGAFSYIIFMQVLTNIFTFLSLDYLESIMGHVSFHNLFYLTRLTY